ncbi:hypothetical protein N1851_007758 [Merluccius polli]|uniref:Uncharacterized protein n=1 Tax=Merluccius polli TaxID=89951 RepID=A0AA47N3T4_MERPO|nr:hypothetical protein N1851_007758 [Merluccius polli]
MSSAALDNADCGRLDLVRLIAVQGADFLPQLKSWPPRPSTHIRLDYCNSLLIGIPNKHLQKLQFIQNCAARTLMKTRKYDHITPILQNLHWLPITSRIQYKIALITHLCIYSNAPQYLKDLLNPHSSTRNLWSQSTNLLHQPRTRLRTMGDRAFCSAAPHTWKSLPEHLRKPQSCVIDDGKERKSRVDRGGEERRRGGERRRKERTGEERRAEETRRVEEGRREDRGGEEKRGQGIGEEGSGEDGGGEKRGQGRGEEGSGEDGGGEKRGRERRGEEGSGEDGGGEKRGRERRGGGVRVVRGKWSIAPSAFLPTGQNVDSVFPKAAEVVTACETASKAAEEE